MSRGSPLSHRSLSVGDLFAYLPDDLLDVPTVQSPSRRSSVERDHTVAEEGYSAKVALKAIRAAYIVRLGQCW